MPAPATGLDDPAAWHLVRDQTGTFQVELPTAWQSQAWVVPTPTMKYPMVSAISPDQRTTMFSGDAELPMFVDPAAAGFGPPPGMVVRPPAAAPQFLAEWVQYRHGGRQGFRLGQVGDDQQLVELAAQAAGRSGIRPDWLTGGRVDAEFDGDDGPLSAAFFATTLGITGIWFAQVHGVISCDDPEDFVAALLRLVASAESTAEEKQRMQAERMASAAQHQATMQLIDQNTAMMTSQHQQRMANIQASGIAHQQNMAARRASFDSGVDAWREQQAGSDAQHADYLTGLRSGAAVPGSGGDPQQDFVNTLKEERTVLDADGQPHQVAAGADRYYYNRYTDTWVGLAAHEDIVEATGGNREDYQEGTIQS